MNDITKDLFALQDLSYRDFHARLMPTVNKENIISVRVPKLRAYAKELAKSEKAERFMLSLPHRYYEENNLHAFLICRIRDFDICIKELERFLPYVDNWATCDGMSPEVLRTQPEKLLEYIKRWLLSEHTYTVRFGVKCLMHFFLDDFFSEEILQLVAGVKSEEYYVNMCCAWFFATALAKQPEAAMPFITEKRLSNLVHNKTMRKALESYRIDDEMKRLLREKALSSKQ